MVDCWWSMAGSRLLVVDGWRLKNPMNLVVGWLVAVLVGVFHSHWSAVGGL